MKNVFFSILCYFSVYTAFTQTVSVNNSTYTADDLTQLLLQNSCINFTNANLSSNLSVGYFNNNGGNFPINEGVILRTGNIIDTQGSYSGNNLGSSTSNGGSDPFLQNLSNTSSGTNEPLLDYAFLEFDFTALSNSFAFNFLFASNEYGEFQCLSNDIFAFELTDLTTNTTTNLAVVPGTSNPVSVKNIKNALYNPNCSSSNPSFFSTYNVTNPASSTINMRGHTVVLSAGGTIIPNNPYRLKLVIADYLSNNYDSAVFISGGSFTTEFNLGADQTICTGDEFTLDTGLDSTYTFEWYQDGNLLTNESGSMYTVTTSGTYEVHITKGSCSISDSITFNELAVNNPNNLFLCENAANSYLFNLNENSFSTLGIDAALYDIEYFTSLANIPNIPIPSNQTNAFSSNGQTIYIKIRNTQTGQFCDAVYPFDLIITPTVVAGTNIVDDVCANQINNYNLAQHNTAVINGQSGNFSVIYFNNADDAQNNNNPLDNIINLPQNVSTVTYGIRLVNTDNPTCFDVTSVTITINPLPNVDTITDIVACTNYQLPLLSEGNYFTGSNGTGQNLGNNPFIEDGGVYYVFVGPDANGCTNETSFNVHFIDENGPILDHCGTFSVPEAPFGIGGYYTNAGGPNGTGTLIPEGTTYTNSGTTTIIQPIYYYAEINGQLCLDQIFNIHIHPVPVLQKPSDVTYCNQYILPSLTDGNYYTGINGTGTLLNAGQAIQTTQTLHVYNEIAHVKSDGSNDRCFQDYAFQVNIINTSIFTNIERCGSYNLPAITFGNYYDAPSGQGNIIDANTPITSSQTVYFYANTTESPNCTENLNFNITIYDIPLVDNIASGTYCGEYILPELTNGTYYTLSGGPSAAGQTTITLPARIEIGGLYPPGTYYVYNETTYTTASNQSITCYNEHSFTIDIIPFSGLDQVISTIECEPYQLGTPNIGTYYTAPDGPNGTGQAVDPTETFTSTETFYLYYIDPTTGCKIDKEFQRIFKGVNLPDYLDVVRCDTYTLPTLTHLPPEGAESGYQIEYHLGSPTGQVLPSGYVFNTTNSTTPQTVYVTALNTDGHFTNCYDEDTFTVTILSTPNIANLGVDFSSINNTSNCGSITLPNLPNNTLYTINYFTSAGDNSTDIIPISNYQISVPPVNPNDPIYSSSPDSFSRTFNIWVYAKIEAFDPSTDTTTSCTDEVQYQFTIHPEFLFEIENGIICVDQNSNETLQGHLLNSQLDPTKYTVEWSLNNAVVGTGITFEALQEGDYLATPIKLTPENAPDCNYLPITVSIIKSSKADAHIVLSQPFENTANAEVVLENGYGNYLYQLDDGNFQDSPIFTNLSSGQHTITIRDVLGFCGDTILTFTVIKYPKFFTPNNDGYNETWNIWDMRTEYPNAVISIFDRYGKFIKQISPSGNGWNGTYNGKPLPSTDYWFTVEYTLNGNQEIFKAHFTMKR